jgi:hypothetical protein
MDNAEILRRLAEPVFKAVTFVSEEMKRMGAAGAAIPADKQS